jgi:hypothetical protein
MRTLRSVVAAFIALNFFAWLTEAGAASDCPCKKIGPNVCIPEAMLAGHSHNYQRYTRTTDLGTGNVKIPYIVAGCGGHAESSVVAANKQQMGETVFEKSMQGYGYLTMTVNPRQLVIEFFETTVGAKRSFDTVTVDVANHSVA